jgi:hypothetical protein
MKYKSVILPTAKEDLWEAAKWYDKARPGLGKELVARFRERLAELRATPLTCQWRDRTFGRAEDNIS